MAACQSGGVCALSRQLETQVVIRKVWEKNIFAPRLKPDEKAGIHEDFSAY